MASTFKKTDSIPIQVGNLEDVLNIIGVGEPLEKYRRPFALLPSGIFPAYYPLNVSGIGAGSPGTITPGANIMTCAPFVIGKVSTIAEVSSSITGGAGNARFAIYTSDPVTLQPQTLIADFGNMANGAIRTVTGLSVQLLPGLYWAAVVTDNAATTVSGFTTTTGSFFGYDSALSGSCNGFSGALTFGAFPTSAPAMTTRIAQNVITLFARFSS